ncbi:MAG TPA: type II secretion system protein GspM [Bradyrhizobium sp.]|uniref:type II secretion system protein GspM n=1 Tax=Bradyrhizobium sp. TaxID=376 RepID=UPI002D7F46F0|nr:type II secretion system protein GspM [Bradyrhizobium sp.]HET7886502.1 type II secretion system protein GspM [Bradyrhizobium sp.]
MNLVATLRKFMVSSPIVAGAVYAGLVIVLLVLAATSLIDLFNQRAAVAASAAMLEQLEGRKPHMADKRFGESGAPSGSAFLEGATVTVAGAALLQRVAAAVTKAGGNVLSSQLDVQGGPNAKAGFVSMVANCELEQAALQALLYDLEAGMPFLFVDQLDIQVATAGESKLRFLLGVSGQWQGVK